MAPPLFSGINHLGIATNDLDRAVRAWSERYGIGPWDIYTKDPSNMRVELDGEPVEFGFRVALAWISPTERIEIIEPLDDASPYARSLRRHGGSDHIHHVRLDVTDFEASARRFEELRVAASMRAEFDGAAGVDSAFVCMYLETEGELGFLVEIGHAPEGFAMPAPDGGPRSLSTEAVPGERGDRSSP